MRFKCATDVVSVAQGVAFPVCAWLCAFPCVFVVPLNFVTFSGYADSSACTSEKVIKGEEHKRTALPDKRITLR